MGGRDPSQDHRTATPLELLFDLTFVIAFGAAANELAHLLAEGHIGTALLGFSFATFGIAWAWINFSWFASAYDTDDWVFRLATMVQMLGVLIFALGLPDMFASLDHGDTVDNRVMVAGYIVMRLALVFQWLRAARQDPPRRAACHKYVTTLLVAQAGWVALADRRDVDRRHVRVGRRPAARGARRAGARRDPPRRHAVAPPPHRRALRAAGDHRAGRGAARHRRRHQRADRPRGPRLVARRRRPRPRRDGAHVRDVVDLLHPADGRILERHRERSFGWGYGHIVLFGALVAVGAGLHAAAYYLEHHSVLDIPGTVLTVAVPVALYVASIYALYYQLSRVFDPFHLLLLAGTAVVAAASVVMAAAGRPMVWCLAVLALTPWVTVVGYETVGYRHGEESLDRV